MSPNRHLEYRQASNRVSCVPKSSPQKWSFVWSSNSYCSSRIAASADHPERWGTRLVPICSGRRSAQTDIHILSTMSRSRCEQDGGCPACRAVSRATDLDGTADRTARAGRRGLSSRSCQLNVDSDGHGSQLRSGSQGNVLQPVKMKLLVVAFFQRSFLFQALLDRH